MRWYVQSPMLYDVFFQRCTVAASFAVGFQRLTQRRLAYIPGNVTLWESPGTAAGLPVIINGVRAGILAIMMFFSVQAPYDAFLIGL
jgi:hypothetical protein